MGTDGLIRGKGEAATLVLIGQSSRHGGYGKIEILDRGGRTVNTAVIDFYSLAADCGIRYVSPVLL